MTTTLNRLLTRLAGIWPIGLHVHLGQEPANLPKARLVQVHPLGPVQRQTEIQGQVLAVAIGEQPGQHPYHCFDHQVLSSLLPPTDELFALFPGLRETGTAMVEVQTLPGLMQHLSDLPPQAERLLVVDMKGSERAVLTGLGALPAEQAFGHVVFHASRDLLYDGGLDAGGVHRLAAEAGYFLDLSDDEDPDFPILHFRFSPELRAARHDASALRRSHEQALRNSEATQAQLSALRAELEVVRQNLTAMPAQPAVVTGPARIAVVVLTMHRSGSSALSRTLNLLGCDLPQTLMGGDATNETGHWESTVIRALNDDVLTSGGSEWQDWLAFNPGWYQTARPAEYLRRAQDVMAAEYGTTSLLVLKDPRICRVFPFWRSVLDSLNISPRVMLPLRHPAEVAASLYRRNGIPDVNGLLLWLRHVLEAESSSRGIPRVVVTYDRLLADPVEVMRAAQGQLGLVWPRLSESVGASIRNFLSPDLRHHTVTDPESLARTPFFAAWLSETYAILDRWAAHGEDPADHAALDTIRAELDAAARPLAAVMAELVRVSQENMEHYKEVRFLRGEAGKRGDALAAMKAENQVLQKRIAESEAKAKALAEQVSNLEAALTAPSRRTRKTATPSEGA